MVNNEYQNIYTSLNKYKHKQIFDTTIPVQPVRYTVKQIFAITLHI